MSDTPQRVIPHFFATVNVFVYFLALTLMVVLVLGCGLEWFFRLVGEQPVDALTLQVNTVPDPWSAWRNTPDIRNTSEWGITNSFGFHSQSEYPVKKADTLGRVEIIGSSVVYGPGLMFSQTLPVAVQRELKDRGYSAEVLNFGHSGFNIRNTLGFVIAYAHQFHPDVIIVNIDMQMAFPPVPAVKPLAFLEGDEGIHRMTWIENLVGFGARHSVILGYVEDPRRLLAFLTTNLPIPIASTTKPAVASNQLENTIKKFKFTVTGQNTLSETTTEDEYFAVRRKQIAPLLAAMASFCQEEQIPLYLITPYGPYFKATDDEYSLFNLKHLMSDAIRIQGDYRKALEKETIFVSNLMEEVAQKSPIRLINMLERAKTLTLAESGLSTDGIHYTPEGNILFGKLIAERITRDGVLKKFRAQ